MRFDCFEKAAVRQTARRLLHAGGCDFAADPRKTADQQPIYWSAAACTDVVMLSALPSGWLTLSERDRPPVASERRAADGRHVHVGSARHQVWLVGDPLPDAALGILMPPDDMFPQRLAAAFVLWRAMHGKPPLRSPPSTARRRARLILGLRALDGRDTGASHRELARGLFGAANVPDGPAWKGHDLKSRVARLVADAVALRDGGYRTLLRSGSAFKP